MALARLLHAHEDEVTCEMARVYHVFDVRALPPRKAATLVLGLGKDAQTLMLAGIFDRLSLLCWAQTTDALRGENRPPSLVEALNGAGKAGSGGFASAEEFERARAAILGGEEHG